MTSTGNPVWRGDAEQLQCYGPGPWFVFGVYSGSGKNGYKRIILFAVHTEPTWYVARYNVQSGNRGTVAMELGPIANLAMAIQVATECANRYRHNKRELNSILSESYKRVARRAPPHTPALWPTTLYTYIPVQPTIAALCERDPRAVTIAMILNKEEAQPGEAFVAIRRAI